MTHIEAWDLRKVDSLALVYPDYGVDYFAIHSMKEMESLPSKTVRQLARIGPQNLKHFILDCLGGARTNNKGILYYQCMSLMFGDNISFIYK